MLVAVLVLLLVLSVLFGEWQPGTKTGLAQPRALPATGAGAAAYQP
jgi:hypothetical protein